MSILVIRNCKRVDLPTSFIKDVFEVGFRLVRVEVRCYVAQLIIALRNYYYSIEECVKNKDLRSKTFGKDGNI
jgi:hypothetical protein